MGSLESLYLIGCNPENRLKKVDLGITDLELRGVNCNRKSANTCIEVISEERTLSLLVKLSILVKCEGISRNNGTVTEFF